MNEEIKSRQNLGNVCYHTMCNLKSSRLLQKQIKIIIHGTVILHIIFIRAWKLLAHMGEEHMQRMNFMVASCINSIKHFIVQLMHTNYKIPR